MIILENYLQRRNICVRSMICLSLLKKEKLTDWYDNLDAENLRQEEQLLV